MCFRKTAAKNLFKGTIVEVQQGVNIRHDCRSTTGRKHKARL